MKVEKDAIERMYIRMEVRNIEGRIGRNNERERSQTDELCIEKKEKNQKIKKS